MRRMRWISLLVVITLLTCTLAAAAAEPVGTPVARGPVEAAPANNPQAEASVQLASSVNLPLMSQSFQTTTIPSGWQTVVSDTARSWGIIDATQNITDFARFVHSWPYAAFISYDLHNQQDEWLYSPPVTISLSFTDTKLSFWALADTNFLSATVIVSLTTSTGITTTLWTLNDENWPAFYYRLVQCDLTPYIGQTIRIIWRYVGFNGQSFGLDDIEISGNANGVWIPIVTNQK
jgi:hypothetical protein